jgi:KamA family protein
MERLALAVKPPSEYRRRNRKVLPLSESERKALQTQGLFRVDMTPYFISLIDPDDPNDPIRKQVIPLAEEMTSFTAMMEDSLAEDRHSPVPGLVHRYPDRVLMLVTTQCASYCRYCTRSRIVGDPGQTFKREEFEMQIEYLKRTPQVRDVLLSGGDPLVLAPKVLEELLSAACAKSPHRDHPHRLARAGLHADARHTGIVRHAGKVPPALVEYSRQPFQ